MHDGRSPQLNRCAVRARLLAALSLPGTARVFCVLVGVLLVACEAEVPELVAVHDIVPPVVEPSEPLRVRGGGFPEGRDARVRLRGERRCAGEAKQPVVLSGSGHSESADAIAFELEPASQRLALGVEHGSKHCVFTGNVQVAFPPEVAGAAPVVGSAHVQLDFLPAPTELSAMDAEPRLAAFLGGEFAPVSEALGLRVVTLGTEGRLAAAGVRNGDVVLRADALAALAPSDLAPAPGQRVAHWLVERAGVQGAAEVTIDVAGYLPEEARRWGRALMLVLPFCLALMGARLGGLRALVLVVTRVRVVSALRSGLLRGKHQAATSANGSVAFGLGAFLAVSALVALMRFRAVPWPADYDLVVLLGALLCSALLARWLEGERAGRWSLFDGLRRVLWAALSQIALLSCLLAVVLDTGHLVVFGGRGLDTSSWVLLHSPSTIVAGGVWLLMIGSTALSSAAYRVRGSVLRGYSERQLDMVHLALLCHCFEAAFLGTGGVMHLSGALLHQFLSTCLFIGALLLGHQLPVPGQYLHRGQVKWVLPWALLAAIGAPAWGAGVWPEWLRESASHALGAAALVLVAAALVRAATLARSRTAPFAINPWL